LTPRITRDITPKSGLEYDRDDQPHKTYPDRLS
jgi:hypothetical protein